MKKIFLTALIAVFTVSAFAQTNKNKGNKMKKEAKEAKADKDKTHTPDGDSPVKFDNDATRFDVNNDGILSPEEKAVRKSERRAYKADRSDDGIMNGSVGDHNMHGKDVSDLARETTLEGREKGKAVSDLAGSKDRKTDRVHPQGKTHPDGKAHPTDRVHPSTGERKPNNVGRPAGFGKPSAAGRPMGAGRKQ